MVEFLKNLLSPKIAEVTGIEKGIIYDLLESPKTIEHGHLAFPVFTLAKSLKKAPPLIAQELQKKLENKIQNVTDIKAMGGYLNFTFQDQFLQEILSNKISESPQKLGFQKPNHQKVVIDYSSPNVAKPMSIGHLRATVIGQAVRNLAESQGYEVTGLNYLGDWGVQFGKLAYAYLEWEGGKANQYPFKEKPFEALFQLYVDFHKACEEDPELEKKGSLTFRRLEEGDPEITKLWKIFLEISLNEYNRIYQQLNVKFDLIQGESFYNDKMEQTIELIKKKSLLEESDGAQVVFFKDDEMPPCILKKSDGATLYATRDVTSAIYRHDKMGAQHLIYVVGVDQNLHFRQVFKVLELMGYEWAKNCHHIAFGMYRFKDMGKMSTRRGKVIFMDDVLNKSIELAKSIIEQKNPDLENKEKVAEQVGVGAIIFNDLSQDRIKDVDFDWDRALDFEGDSGPYVQYSIVRCKSILRKFGREIPAKMEVPLTSPQERHLVRLMLNYSEALTISYKNFKPSFLAQYLLDVCRAFSSFYQSQKILDPAIDEKLTLSRLRLVQCVESLLTQGLGILGVQSPEKM